MRIWPYFILSNVLLAAYLLGLSLLLIVPAIIYLVYWIFLNQVVIIENQFGRKALTTSKTLVRGRWWKVMGYLVAFAAMAILLCLSLSSVYLLLPSLPSWQTITILGFVIGFGITLVCAYFHVILTVFYLDLKKQSI